MQQHLHGGDWESLTVPVRLDYSTNLNPLGMPPEIKQALQAHMDDYVRYPDSQCRALRQALSQWEQVPASWILCGNGAADLLLRICQAVQPKQTLLPGADLFRVRKGRPFGAKPDCLSPLAAGGAICLDTAHFGGFDRGN